MKKKKIVIISGSRADFYLLLGLYNSLKKYKKYNLEFILTGGSAKKNFYKNVSNNFKKNSLSKIYLKIYKDKKTTTPNAISEIISKLSSYFSKKKVDLVVLLGDRYEILGAAIAAHSMDIKIAHFHGGEITLGSKDNDYRNSITSFSDYHFVSNKIHANRVKDIKNINKNIFDIGSLGIDFLKKTKFLKKNEIEKKLKIRLRKIFSIITIHPETKNYLSEKSLRNLFSALKYFPEIDFIFTYPGYDFGYKKILNKLIKKKKEKNIYIFENLGQLMYHSLIKYSSFVLGNSSSGIIEVPSLKKYSINLGNRQKGRIHSKFVLHSKFLKKKIISLINKVIKLNKKNKIYKNPYERANTIVKSTTILKKLLNEK